MRIGLAARLHWLRRPPGGCGWWHQWLKLPAWRFFLALACVLLADKDLFGAEPFDPFTCGAADFPPDIQSKLDEMQVSPSAARL